MIRIFEKMVEKYFNIFKINKYDGHYSKLLLKCAFVVLFTLLYINLYMPNVFAAKKNITSSDITLGSTGQPWYTYQDTTVYNSSRDIDVKLYDQSVQLYLNQDYKTENISYNFSTKMLSVDIVGIGSKYEGRGTIKFYKKPTWYQSSKSGFGDNTISNFDSLNTLHVVDYNGNKQYYEFYGKSEIINNITIYYSPNTTLTSSNYSTAGTVAQIEHIGTIGSSNDSYDHYKLLNLYGTNVGYYSGHFYVKFNNGVDYSTYSRSGTFSLQIDAVPTISYTSSGYTGTYDGNPHGITVSVSSPSGATIKYGETSGTYNLDSSPTLTEVGTKIVYFRITKSGYQTVTGSETIKINALPNLSGSVSITGSTVWGQKLTANVINTDNASLSYKWYSNASNSTSGGTAISGATNSTYTIDKSLVGNYIYVEVTATKTGYSNAIWKAKTGPVTKQNLSVTKTPYSGTYDGSAHGATIKVTSSEWNGKKIDSGTNTNYEQSVTTNGVKNTNYTLKPTYTNATSAVTVYYKVTGGDYYNDATGSTTVTISNNTLSGSVSITGSTVWGQTLTANVTNTDNASLSYKWYSNVSNSTSGGTAISGATNSTYTIDKSLVGNYIYVEVTATKSNYNSATWKASTGPVTKQNLSVTKSPYSGTYDGNAHGATIKVTSSEWNGKKIDSGTNTNYNQSVTTNGVKNTNYTLKPTYTNVTSETTVYYKVTGGDYYNDATGSTTVTIYSKALSGSVTITGSTVWGQTLTANVTNKDDASLSYKWYSNASDTTSGGTPINGATNSTYTIDKSLVGNYIYVEVTATKSNYNSATWKASTGPVNKQNLAVTVTPYNGVYNGSAHGATIKVTSNEWSGSIIESGTNTNYEQSVTTSGVKNTDYTLKPTYTNVTSAVTVYYKVTGGDYYNDATGSSTVTISKAAGSMSFSPNTVTKTYGDANFTKTVTKIGDGTVSYSSNRTSVATVNSSTGEITINNAGSATITATVVDGANYTYSPNTATYTLTINKAQGSGSVTMDNWIYGENPSDPIPVSDTNGTENVTYMYVGRGNTTYPESFTKPIYSGKYTVIATFAATSNYSECTATDDFEIVSNEITLMTATRIVRVSDIRAPFGMITIRNKIQIPNSDKEGIATRNVTLDISAVDIETKVESYILRNENNITEEIEADEWEDFPENDDLVVENWELSPNDGDKTVYLMLKDSNGNTTVSFIH